MILFLFFHFPLDLWFIKIKSLLIIFFFPFTVSSGVRLRIHFFSYPFSILPLFHYSRTCGSVSKFISLYSIIIGIVIENENYSTDIIPYSRTFSIPFSWVSIFLEDQETSLAILWELIRIIPFFICDIISYVNYSLFYLPLTLDSKYFSWDPFKSCLEYTLIIHNSFIFYFVLLSIFHSFIPFGHIFYLFT